MKTFLFITFQYLIPQHFLSRIVGRIAASEIPWVKNLFIRQFIKKYQVNLSEAKITDEKEYTSFNDFFHRELKADAREINNTHNGIVSPADGAFSQLGAIENGRIFQAKGQSYSALELLAGNSDLEKDIAGGQFATIYLSPKDYHRVHMPVTGTLVSMTHVPGALFSVNPTTADNVPRLFSRNERVIAQFSTDNGPMIMVLVGAMIVASIDTVWAGQISPTGKKVSYTKYGASPLTLEKGAEMGRFKLGSTVILLFPKDSMEWGDNISAGSQVEMGNSIGDQKRP